MIVSNLLDLKLSPFLCYVHLFKAFDLDKNKSFNYHPKLMSYIIWHCYLDQKNTLSRSCYLRGFLDTRCQISRNIMRVFCCLPCKTIKYRFWFMAWRAKNRKWVKSLDGLKFSNSSVPPHKIIWILLIGCKFCPPFSDWSEQPWPSFLVLFHFGWFCLRYQVFSKRPPAAATSKSDNKILLISASVYLNTHYTSVQQAFWQNTFHTTGKKRN